MKLFVTDLEKNLKFKLQVTNIKDGSDNTGEYFDGEEIEEVTIVVSKTTAFDRIVADVQKDLRKFNYVLVLIKEQI